MSFRHPHKLSYPVQPQRISQRLDEVAGSQQRNVRTMIPSTTRITSILNLSRAPGVGESLRSMAAAVDLASTAFIAPPFAPRPLRRTFCSEAAPLLALLWGWEPWLRDRGGGEGCCSARCDPAIDTPARPERARLRFLRYSPSTAASASTAMAAASSVCMCCLCF